MTGMQGGNAAAMVLHAARVLARMLWYWLHAGPAAASIPDRYRALFSPIQSTVQLFMWRQDIVGVARYIMDSFLCPWCPA